MAVLGRDEFLNKLRALTGDDTSDETLSTIEDFTETYDILCNSENEDWKKKYEENDAEWRKKYKEAFFTPSDNRKEYRKPNNDEEERATSISIEDLFKGKEG